MREKTKQNKKKEEQLFFIKGPENKDAKPKKSPRDKGINIIEKGIKFFKFSSNVSEQEIQYVPERKKPTPKKYPTKKRFFK